jgi:indole-3-glycerol phosphate synthase
MSEFLTAMATSSRRRAGVLRKASDESVLMARARKTRAPLPLVLSHGGFDLVGEAKLASPADGELVAHTDALEAVSGIAESLARSGCAALSVLTEPDAFGGAMTHLEAVAASVDLPVMRKDFLVDPIQVIEARAAGASGVLLIARMVSPDLLVEMTDLAIELGMFALIEVFAPADLDTAAAVFDRKVLIGVNSRDLTTLKVDRRRHAEMAPLLPSHLPAVAESGIATEGDAGAVARSGYRMALVGGGLVTRADPAATAARLIAAGRAAVIARAEP